MPSQQPAAFTPDMFEPETARKMKRLYDRLYRDFKMDAAYVRETVLPSWWNDQIAESSSGYSYAVAAVARQLRLDLRSVESDAAILTPLESSRRFWKVSQDQEQDLQASKRIVESAADTAIAAAPKAKQTLLPSALEIRECLVKTKPAGVSFQSLVRYCWDCGIPVLHVSKFPHNSRKMVGVALEIDGRQAIVLTYNHRYPARMIFPLAHELGHIVHGHLTNGAVFDSEMEIEEIATNAQEIQANEFASLLLTGLPSQQLVTHQKLVTAEDLVNKCRAVSRYYQVDTGYLVAKYGHETANWSVAMKALGKLQKSNAVAVMQDCAERRLKWDELDSDSVVFLRKVMGISGES